MRTQQSILHKLQTKNSTSFFLLKPQAIKEEFKIKMNEENKPIDTNYFKILANMSNITNMNNPNLNEIHTISSSAAPQPHNQPIHQFNSHFMNVNNNNNTNYRSLPYMNQTSMIKQDMGIYQHQEQQQQQQQQQQQLQLQLPQDIKYSAMQQNINPSQNHPYNHQQTMQTMAVYPSNTNNNQQNQHLHKFLAQQEEKMSKVYQVVNEMKKNMFNPFLNACYQQQMNPQFNQLLNASYQQQMNPNAVFSRSLPIGAPTTQEAKSGSHRPDAEGYHATMVKIAEEKGMILKIDADGNNCPGIQPGQKCKHHNEPKHYWCFLCNESFKWQGNSTISQHITRNKHDAYSKEHIMFSINVYFCINCFFFVDSPQFLLLFIYFTQTICNERNAK